LFYLAVTNTVGTAGSDIPFKLFCLMSKGFILKNLFRRIIPNFPIIKKRKNKCTYIKTCNGKFLRYFRDERCRPTLIYFMQFKRKTERM